MKEIKTWRKFIPGLAFPKGEDCFVIGREIRPTPLVAICLYNIAMNNINANIAFLNVAF